jgi:5-methylcytosine-specific restriction endonuclease McrA
VPAGTCKRCGDATGNPDGRQWYCEPCRAARIREAGAAERARNRQRKPCQRCGGAKELGARRKYCDACRPLVADENRQRKRDYDARRYPTVRETMQALARSRRLRDPEWAAQGNIRAREWVKANPERAAELRRVRVLAYRARKRGAHVEHVEPFVVLERDDGLCGICGLDVDPQYFDIDHIIPLARGGEHSYRNVQVAHRRCNQRKGARLLGPATTSMEG